MLLVRAEREVIIREHVGIVFLTQDVQDLAKLLSLLLLKWDWITSLEWVQRPFAYFLSPNGRIAESYKHYRL